jgi:CheY-like chemotaxis protein
MNTARERKVNSPANSPAHSPILVVDDDFDVRASIEEILQEAGYPVQTAANGIEALQVLREGPRPALILLDLMMPVVDGADFCHAWAEDPDLSRIPVFIISADATTRAQARDLGTNGYLAKPIRLDELLAVAQRYAAG